MAHQGLQSGTVVALAKNFNLGRLGSTQHRAPRRHTRPWTTVTLTPSAHLRPSSVGTTAVPHSRSCAWRLTAKHECRCDLGAPLGKQPQGSQLTLGKLVWACNHTALMLERALQSPHRSPGVEPKQFPVEQAVRNAPPCACAVCNCAFHRTYSCSTAAACSEGRPDAKHASP